MNVSRILALGGSIYRILRVWKALGGPFCRVLRGSEALGGRPSNLPVGPGGSAKEDPHLRGGRGRGRGGGGVGFDEGIEDSGSGKHIL